MSLLLLAALGAAPAFCQNESRPAVSKEPQARSEAAQQAGSPAQNPGRAIGGEGLSRGPAALPAADAPVEGPGPKSAAGPAPAPNAAQGRARPSGSQRGPNPDADDGRGSPKDSKGKGKPQPRKGGPRKGSGLGKGGRQRKSGGAPETAAPQPPVK